MPTYVIRNGELIEKHLAPPRTQSSAAPGVISDIMEPTKHMASGKYFTSKAAFRAETKAYGCIEVGTDPSITRPRKPVTLSREKRVEDIKRTIYELRNGR
jgi:hypothetical protein